MKAALYEGPREIAIEEVEDPRLTGPDTAIVRILVGGICGTDCADWLTGGKAVAGGPRVGHEFIGQVVAAGPVAKYLQDAWVVAPFMWSCGTCDRCARGVTPACRHGGMFGGLDSGGLGELALVPHASHTLVPLGVKPTDPQVAARFLACADVLPTGWHAAVQAGVKPGDRVVVLGDGPVGLCAVLAAREQGAQQVVAVGHHDRRLRLAAEFGATEVLQEDERTAEVLRDLTDGGDVSSVLLCANSQAAVELASNIVRPGGVVSCAGAQVGMQWDLHPLWLMDVDLKLGVTPARKYVAPLVDRVNQPGNRLGKVAEIFDFRGQLLDVPEAFKAMFDRREVTKALLTLQPSSNGLCKPERVASISTAPGTELSVNGAPSRSGPLADQTVVVTGGSHGLGLEFARQLVAAGANVIITARDEARLRAAELVLGVELRGVSLTVAEAHCTADALAESLKGLSGVVIPIGMVAAKVDDVFRTHRMDRYGGPGYEWDVAEGRLVEKLRRLGPTGDTPLEPPGGNRVLSVQGDLTDPESMPRVLRRIEEAGLEPVTAVVNNAGMPGPIGSIWRQDLDLDEWWRAYELNIRGTMLATHAVLPGMMERGRGRIVNMVTRAAQVQRWARATAYGPSKLAVVRLTRDWAKEQADAGDTGITIIAFEPGLIAEVGMTRDLLRAKLPSGDPEFDQAVMWFRKQRELGHFTPVGVATAQLVELLAGLMDDRSGEYVALTPDDLTGAAGARPPRQPLVSAGVPTASGQQAGVLGDGHYVAAAEAVAAKEHGTR